MTVKRRQELAVLIKKESVAWAIGRAEASEIDQINILQATLLAMTRAYQQLPIQPDWVQVDGTFYPDIDCPGETIIKGDSKVAEISAASIIAKVARDEEMETLDLFYPGYAFSKHKGYPTKLHLEKLHQLGVIDVHRKSFSPVKKQLTLYFAQS